MAVEDDDEVCIQIEPPLSVYRKGFLIEKTLPCFRNTWLYSISSGIFVYVSTFMLTSHTSRSFKYGWYSFAGTFASYLLFCGFNVNYQKSQKERLEYGIYEHSEKIGVNSKPS